MYYKRSTQVPNKLFDIYLKTLSLKELKVLLVVIRQTIGWVDAKGNRKKRDWMSQKFLANKTGLSPKAVSQGIDVLVSKQLIDSTLADGTELRYASERKGKERIYYGPTETLITFLPKPSVKSTQDPITKSNMTKLTYTKLTERNSNKNENSNNTVRSLEDIIQRRDQDL